MTGDASLARRALLAYVVLAAGLLALYWWPEAKLLAGDERAYYQPRALAVMAGGDWFDPQMLWPPLQVLLLAGLWSLVGPSLLAVQLLQLVLLALSGWLLADLWRALTGNARAATWAGILLAVNPLTIAYATYLWPEILHLFLSLLMARALLMARSTPSPATAIAFAAAAGAALALCLLSKSLLTAFWPLLLPVLVQRRRLATSAVRVLAFGLALAVVMAPVLLRGQAESGRLQVADSSWFNLWTGLADTHRSDLVDDQTGPRMARYLASAPDHAGRVDFARDEAQVLLAERGIVATVLGQLGKQYFRLFDSRHFLVAQLPGPACLGYIDHYHLQPGLLARAIDVAARAWHVALLLLFAFGLATWTRWREPWVWLLAAFIGYQLALFLGLHVKTRFLLPMLPVICAVAGAGLARRGELGSGVVALSRARLALGLVLGLLLATLALAGPWLDQACADPPVDAATAAAAATIATS